MKVNLLTRLDTLEAKGNKLTQKRQSLCDAYAQKSPTGFMFMVKKSEMARSRLCVARRGMSMVKAQKTDVELFLRGL